MMLSSPVRGSRRLPSHVSRLIVIGASAGGLHALQHVVSRLPAGLPAAVLIVMHTGGHRSALPELLARHSALPVRHAANGEALRGGVVLVAPPDRHLLVANDGGQPHLALLHGPKENYARPAIDPLFRSAAEVAGPDAVGVILTGYLDDGAVGLKAIKECGGIAVVQHPSDAEVPDMPANALQQVAADYCVKLVEIGPLLAQLAHGERPPAQYVPATPLWVKVENSFARSMANMQALDDIGAPSTYTCPDCSGTLWQVSEPPVHFRCHTGHGYTAGTLLDLQNQIIEQALWACLRALQEKAALARQLAEERSVAPRDYLSMAEHAERTADQLKALLREATQGT